MKVPFVQRSSQGSVTLLQHQESAASSCRCRKATSQHSQAIRSPAPASCVPVDLTHNELLDFYTTQPSRTAHALIATHTRRRRRNTARLATQREGKNEFQIVWMVCIVVQCVVGVAVDCVNLRCR